MAIPLTSEKRMFIQRLIADGTSAPGQIQRALVEKFGSGVAPKDLGPLVRGHGRTSKVRDRKRVVSSSTFLVMRGVDQFTAQSHQEAIEIIGRLLDEGSRTEDISLYERVVFHARTEISLSSTGS